MLKHMNATCRKGQQGSFDFAQGGREASWGAPELGVGRPGSISGSAVDLPPPPAGLEPCREWKVCPADIAGFFP